MTDNEGTIVTSISHGFFVKPLNEECEWIITRDHLIEQFPEDAEDSNVNTRSLGWSKVADKLERTYRFRIYDDDDVLYYEGSASAEGFDPLDWAAANDGATRIDFRQEDGSWRTL